MNSTYRRGREVVNVYDAFISYNGNNILGLGCGVTI
jgi:hypothetical protein